MSLLLVYAIHSQKEFFNDPSFRIKAKTECSLHLCPYGQWPCQYYLFFLPRYHKYFSVEMFSVDILFLWSYWALRSCASYSEQPDLEIKVHTISDKNLTAVAALKAAFIFPTNDPMHRPVELFCTEMKIRLLFLSHTHVCHITITQILRCEHWSTTLIKYC